MFEGTAKCTLDPKSRIVIPANFRKYIKPEAHNKLVITRGLDQSLWLYPNDEWEKYKAALMQYNTFDSKQRFFLRQFLHFVRTLEIDSQNRILIPSMHIEFAQLGKEIELEGMLDKIEIWNPDIRNSYNGSQDMTYEDIAQQIYESTLKKNV
jgi:MraZ protein